MKTCVILSTKLICAEAPFGIDEDALGVEPDEFQLVPAESEVLQDDAEAELVSIDE